MPTVFHPFLEIDFFDFILFWNVTTELFTHVNDKQIDIKSRHSDHIFRRLSGTSPTGCSVHQFANWKVGHNWSTANLLLYYYFVQRHCACPLKCHINNFGTTCQRNYCNFFRWSWIKPVLFLGHERTNKQQQQQIGILRCHFKLEWPVVCCCVRKYLVYHRLLNYNNFD
jgi:hypothetical protein